MTLTPHMASAASEVRTSMCQLALDNVLAVLDGAKGGKMPLEVL